MSNVERKLLSTPGREPVLYLGQDKDTFHGDGCPENLRARTSIGGVPNSVPSSSVSIFVNTKLSSVGF